MSVCHCVSLCVTVCHRVSLCVTVCHCVSLCVCHCAAIKIVRFEIYLYVVGQVNCSTEN